MAMNESKAGVLAVMERNGFICGDPTSEISQARADVAELLLRAELITHALSKGDLLASDIAFLDSAVARCKGGAQ